MSEDALECAHGVHQMTCGCLATERSELLEANEHLTERHQKTEARNGKLVAQLEELRRNRESLIGQIKGLTAKADRLEEQLAVANAALASERSRFGRLCRALGAMEAEADTHKQKVKAIVDGAMADVRRM